MSYDVEDKRGSKYIIQTPLTFATKIRLTGHGRDVARCCCQLLRLRYIARDHQTRQELSKAFVKMSDTKHNFANSSSLMYCRARSMTAPQPSRWFDFPRKRERRRVNTRECCLPHYHIHYCYRQFNLTDSCTMGRGWRRITEAVRLAHAPIYSRPTQWTTHKLSSPWWLQVRQKMPGADEFETTSNRRNEAMFREASPC